MNVEIDTSRNIEIFIVMRDGHVDVQRAYAPRAIIGRSGPELEQRIFHSIDVDDPTVSRDHAVVAPCEDGTLALRDLGSANGTIIDGEWLPPGRWVRLGPDGRFTFAGLEAVARVVPALPERRLPRVRLPLH